MKSLMQLAKRMPRQPLKRRQGRAGKGDMQFGQTSRKGALIWFMRVIPIMVVRMK